MLLTPEVIAHCKKELKLENDFEACEEVTANDELFEQWKNQTKRINLPKLIFYILLDEVFGASYQYKDNKGCLGRKLKLKNIPDNAVQAVTNAG